METVKIREPRRLALDNYLMMLDVLSERISRIERILEDKAELTKEVKWLESHWHWVSQRIAHPERTG